MAANKGGLGYYLGLSRQRAAEGHLSFARQLAEMAVLQVAHAVGPGYYHLSGMWRRSLPWSDKWGHLGGPGYTRAVARLNPEEFRGVSQHKLAEKAVLQRIGIACSQLVGFVGSHGGVTHDGGPLDTPLQFASLLADIDDTEMAMKLVASGEGKGFSIVEVMRESGTPAIRRRGEDAWRSPEVFWRDEVARGAADGLLFERVIHQCDEMRRINPSSVNSLRIWVRRDRGRPAYVQLAYLRIGRAGSMVDNQTAGGIVAPVDLATGKLRAALCGTAARREYPVHPDHGAAIEGVAVPQLAEAIAMSERCLNLWPVLRFVGLDVAISDAGPVMIELNPRPDRQGSAFTDTPSRPLVT